MAETEERPLRGCESCGVVDDHPRVVHPMPATRADGEPQDAGVPSDEILDRLLEDGRLSAAAIRMLMDPLTVVRHHDCCVQAGCPADPSPCAEIVAAAKGKTGNDLVAVIKKEF